jgi:hypothetical protein
MAYLEHSQATDHSPDSRILGETDTWFTPACTFTEAKKLAKAEARRLAALAMVPPGYGIDVAVLP